MTLGFVHGLLCALQRSTQTAGTRETALLAAVKKTAGIVAHCAPPAIKQAPVRAALRVLAAQAATRKRGQQHLRVAAVGSRPSRGTARGAGGAGAEPRSLPGAKGAPAPCDLGASA